MANNSYRLRYLPLFYTDLEEKVAYIADEGSDKIMEVRRFLYKGRDRDTII